MGDIVVTKCDCGYESKNLCIGLGMEGSITDIKIIALCRKCSEVVTAGVLDESPICPVCKENTISYEDKNLSSGEEKCTTLKDFFAEKIYPAFYDQKLYLCPKCNEKKMRLIEVGCWD